MKRLFEIEWPDDCGQLWMNTSNLLICLTDYCRNTKFTVRDVTGDGEACTVPETAGPTNPIQDTRDMEAILQAIARGWCSERNQHKTMDAHLAEDIAKELFAATR